MFLKLIDACKAELHAALHGSRRVEANMQQKGDRNWKRCMEQGGRTLLCSDRVSMTRYDTAEAKVAKSEDRAEGVSN